MGLFSRVLVSLFVSGLVVRVLTRGDEASGRLRITR